MSINDVEDQTDFDSETEMDEEKRASRIKKKQVNKKTLVEQQARMDDYLWQIVNESGCVTNLIFQIRF